MNNPQTWKLNFKGNNAAALKLSFLNNLEYRLAKDHFSATAHDNFLSSAYVVAERLIEKWIATQQRYHRDHPKRVYYLSMEFMMGRSLENGLINLGIVDSFKQALGELGMNLDDICEKEADAGLGNGGLGRLAACFLDSMATIGIPAHGYTLRYEYGLFKQDIVDGRQIETPDNWLALPNPWEIARPEYVFKVHFYGRVEHRTDNYGKTTSYWLDTEEVQALPYDMPVPGYRTETVNTLRMWSAKAAEEFNFGFFNHGDYMAACEKQVHTENITKVLYPNDTFFEGKELRLKQEYFLVSASIQDIIRRFKSEKKKWQQFPEQAVIQLNDTHPSLAIPELMRILIDEEGLDWNSAWDICVRTFAYTNHTVLPEALEEWPVSLLENLLPRHLEIIYQINHNFLNEVAMKYPGDNDRLRRMSMISEEGVKRVRMAFLSVVGSHKVNGVAELHTRLIKETILKDFYEMFPHKFTNKTNGVTPRRWIRKANPKLSSLITEAVGDGWVKDLSKLRNLEPMADDEAFQKQWNYIQEASKEALVQHIRDENGIVINPDSMFDVLVKRIHEYKRQFMFALYIIHKYLEIKENPDKRHASRTCIIGGKAAPGYAKAKLIIKLINNIAEIVNSDPEVNGFLRVAFVANYSVSLAEKIIPAASLSEQISTAGYEASGTGNMKMTMNGALTIGTLDGANIEIMEEVGRENIFIFGHNADEIKNFKSGNYNPREWISKCPELQAVLHLLESAFFSRNEPGLFRPLYEELWNRDEFCLAADFPSYIEAQKKADEVYNNPAEWARMSILNVARSSKFSSDRTIEEYARDIWGVIK